MRTYSPSMRFSPSLSPPITFETHGSSPCLSKFSLGVGLLFSLGGVIAGCVLLALGLQRQQFFNALDPATDFSTQPGQCTILAIYQRNILRSESCGTNCLKDVCYAQLSYEFTGPFAKAINAMKAINTINAINAPSSQDIVAALNAPGVMDRFNDKGGDTWGLKRYGGWKLATTTTLDNATAALTGHVVGIAPDDAHGGNGESRIAGVHVAMSRVESIKLHDSDCTFPEDADRVTNGYFRRGGEGGNEKAVHSGGKSSMESFWVGDKTDCWQANDMIHVRKTAVVDGIEA